MGEVASNQAVACCNRCLRGTGSCRSLLSARTSSWLDPRVTALKMRNGVFTVSSPMCCFQAKVEMKDGSRDVNKFVYKPTKWMTKSKALAQALGKPFHRHIVLNGGLANVASTYAPELVNTVLRGLRQQRLDDGWISELELQFAGPSPTEPQR